MRFYAERPFRMLAQLLADALAVAWVVLAVRFAQTAAETVLEWQAPGQRMVEAGGGLQHTFVDASRTAGKVPFVGDDLAGVLGKGTAAGDGLTSAGSSLIEAVGYLATGVSAAIIVLAVLPLLIFWLPLRLRYARKASKAARMRRTALDLLALRALTTLSYRQLKVVDANPAAAWRQGDEQAIRALADLQLKAAGLRPAQR